MEIIIYLKNGKRITFNNGTVVGFKSSDRTFLVLTNNSEEMRIYNMSIIDRIQLSAYKGSVMDYILKD